MTEKIIFLDIDGPMIPYRCLVLPDQPPIMTIFDPVAVSLLNHLCEEFGWKIVLHSSWIRIIGGFETYEHCIKQGIKQEHFHKDAWCDEYIGWRYDRVADWLRKHPDVKTYVIVDDEPYKDGDTPFEGMSLHMVMVNYYDGFLYRTFNDIRAKDRDEVKEMQPQVFKEDLDAE